jgi:uncharacterized protein YciI
MPEFIYQILPGGRPELTTDPSSWTKEDEAVSASHFRYLEQAAEEGTLILAGRSQDGIGPALVIFEAEDEAAARRFMEDDPFIREGLFRSSLHPYRVALMRSD